MKKAIKYIFVVSLIFLASCNQDLLDLTNPNVPTTATFWKTTSDLQSGLTATYSQFTRPGNWGRWIYFRYDLTSDEGYSKSGWVELADWTRFNYSNYNFIQGNSLVYKDHYKQIFEANQVIYYGGLIKVSSATDSATVKKIVAQAKFIRAFDYFNLNIMFGRGELVINPSKPGDVYPMINSNQIDSIAIKDLNDAIVDLPATWSAADKGRITKGAAYALLGKIYMQRHEWQNAKNSFYWLVEGDGMAYYGLMTNYTDNFLPSTENNKESVFEIQFSNANPTPTDMNNNTIYDDNIPNMNVGSSRSKFMGLQDNNLAWPDANVRPWLVTEYKKEKTVSNTNDPRLLANIFYPAMFTDNPGITCYNGTVTRWHYGTLCYFRKYSDDAFKAIPDYYSPTNYRVIRFADILLCYAECIANLNPSDVSTAATYVDKVRARVKLSTLANSTIPEIAASVTSSDLFLKRLQTERTLELCFESVRWIDLKRWGLWNTPGGLAELIARDPDFANFDVTKHTVMPLPQLEVDNNQNLKQNSGY